MATALVAPVLPMLPNDGTEATTVASGAFVSKDAEAASTLLTVLVLVLVLVAALARLL